MAKNNNANGKAPAKKDRITENWVRMSETLEYLGKIVFFIIKSNFLLAIFNKMLGAKSDAFCIYLFINEKAKWKRNIVKKFLIKVLNILRSSTGLKAHNFRLNILKLSYCVNIFEIASIMFSKRCA